MDILMIDGTIPFKNGNQVIIKFCVYTVQLLMVKKKKKKQVVEIVSDCPLPLRLFNSGHTAVRARDGIDEAS